MPRLFATVVLVGAAWCAPASAGVLVFQRPLAGGPAAIVLARASDGRGSRMIGRGAYPVVAPNGHRVAFIEHRGGCPQYVFGPVGCGRLVVADVTSGSIRQIAPFAEPPISWSGDSRYVATQVANQNKTSTQVIRLRDGHRHVFAVAGSVASIAFSPDDSQVVICAGDDYGPESLSLAATSGGRATSYGPLGACWGAWSRYGLAYTTTDATKYTFSTYADVLLRSPAHAPARTLYRLGPDGGALLVGWSGNGELLATASDATGTHAVVIDPRNNTTTTVRSAPSGLAVDAVSSDASRILVEQDHNILAIAVRTGAATVLEKNASSPTWND